MTRRNEVISAQLILSCHQKEPKLYKPALDKAFRGTVQPQCIIVHRLDLLRIYPEQSQRVFLCKKVHFPSTT